MAHRPNVLLSLCLYTPTLSHSTLTLTLAKMVCNASSTLASYRPPTPTTPRSPRVSALGLQRPHSPAPLPPTIYTLNTCCLPAYHIPRSAISANSHVRHQSLTQDQKSASSQQRPLSLQISTRPRSPALPRGFHFHIVRRVRVNKAGHVRVAEGKTYVYLKEAECEARGLVVPMEPSPSGQKDYSPLYEHLNARSASLQPGVYEISPATRQSIALAASMPTDQQNTQKGDLLYIPDSAQIGSSTPSTQGSCVCDIVTAKRLLGKELKESIRKTPAVVMC